MHVNAKRISFLGLLMAFCVILVILGSVLEMSTLFFLALASLGTGVAIAEFGVTMGAGFFVGSVLLTFMLSPNKFYVPTYAGMSFYLLLTQFLWIRVMKRKASKTNQIIMYIVKFIVFNAMYIPILIIAPQLVITKKMSSYLFVGLLIAGQVVLVIYDRACSYFMERIWLDIKRRLKI